MFLVSNIQSQPDWGGCEKYYIKNVTARRIDVDIF